MTPCLTLQPGITSGRHSKRMKLTSREVNKLRVRSAGNKALVGVRARRGRIIHVLVMKARHPGGGTPSCFPRGKFILQLNLL